MDCLSEREFHIGIISIFIKIIGIEATTSGLKEKEK